MDKLNEELLDHLRNYYNVHGKPPKQTDFKKPGYPTLSSYYKQFGTWNKALEKAGLPTNRKNDKKFLEDVEAVIKDKGILTVREMRTEVPGFKYALKRYGNSYNELIVDLGYDPKFTTPKKVSETNEELIDMYVDFSNRIGRTATRRDIDEDDDMYSASVYSIRFGSLNKLRELADIEVIKQGGTRLYNVEYFMKIFTEVYKNHGIVTDEKLDEILVSKGTAINTAKHYFKTTKTSTIWKIVEDEIKKGDRSNE